MFQKSDYDLKMKGIIPKYLKKKSNIVSLLEILFGPQTTKLGKKKLQYKGQASSLLLCLQKRFLFSFISMSLLNAGLSKSALN